MGSWIYSFLLFLDVDGPAEIAIVNLSAIDENGARSGRDIEADTSSRVRQSTGVCHSPRNVDFAGATIGIGDLYSNHEFLLSCCNTMF